MGISIKIITKDQMATSEWSGGTTTEMYIAPFGATYSTRNFDIRISSARVELETSTFTALPGFDRHLMILEGTLSVHHVGHYEKQLNPMETDSFSGDWETHSVGKVLDFNLMLRRGMTGRLKAFQLSKGSVCPLGVAGSRMTLLYAHHGSFQLQTSQDSWSVNEGEACIMDWISVGLDENVASLNNYPVSIGADTLEAVVIMAQVDE